MEQITLTRPDDWHIHLRDGAYLKRTVEDASRYFGRVLAMPNLFPPITSGSLADNYRKKILSYSRTGFEPLFALYLTEETTPHSVNETKENYDFVPAYKLYPSGVTTNSEFGIKSIENMYPVFDAIQENDLVLCIHGEVTNPEVDVYDRESYFIDKYLKKIVQTFPSMRIVLEHITTEEAVNFIKESNDKVAATITAHHLLYDRNKLLAGTLNPLYYCLPILKRNTHQKALIEAAISGNKSFFLGTDSAPHPRQEKEKICGCAAGCYTSHAGIELYAEVFDSQNAMSRLEGFSSHFGADFYRFPRNRDTITMERRDWIVDQKIDFGGDELTPIKAGETLNWKIESGENSTAREYQLE
ncbi:MAG: dihydroorotase [Gammaproteobacteria bacterium]|nr:dihydroorotase [Gammaproteobacteria bacterium]|tara:strand:- start:93 stop:1163 length:1071 start_codon:yes stop_codon:yes gene_type:complete